MVSRVVSIKITEASIRLRMVGWSGSSVNESAPKVSEVRGAYRRQVFTGGGVPLGSPGYEMAEADWQKIRLADE